MFRNICSIAKLSTSTPQVGTVRTLSEPNGSLRREQVQSLPGAPDDLVQPSRFASHLQGRGVLPDLLVEKVQVVL